MDKRRFRITLKVSNEVKVQFLGTKEFIEECLEQQYLKENVSVEEVIFLQALKQRVSTEKHFLFCSEYVKLNSS